MNKEQIPNPLHRKPYEVFGLTEEEVLYWRVGQEHFQEIINDDQTTIHAIKTSSNNYGEFLFVTTSRQGDHARIAMTFFGLGYHEHRERWLTNEWFWYQTNILPEIMRMKIEKEEAEELIQKRLNNIIPYSQEDTQTDYGRLFEMLADLTDEDGALAELQDLEKVAKWLHGDPDADSGPEPEFKPPPRGDNLLDRKSRDNLQP